MADGRLIDANALYDTICKYSELKDRSWPTWIENLINVAPTIDAVEVVRCRECKYWSGRKDKPGEATAIGYCDHPNHHIMPLNANWYCADGVKRNGGTT